MLETKYVVDADSHWSEPPDLFTSRAPEKYRDRVPRVEFIDDQATWVFDGHPVGRAGAGAVIGRDGKKADSATALDGWINKDAHLGAWDPTERLKVLDEFSIDAQVIFPSTIGLGGQDLGMVDDEALRRATVEIYNDGMIEIQKSSGDRLLPMPLMPAWDIDACVYEAERMANLGARGINMTSDPQDLGSPDLANRAWDPFWEVCADRQLPVHFHIGASITAMTFFGNYSWASQARGTQLAIGGTMLFIGNARIVVNTILSGVFDRHPNLQIVSVESGIGWIPFILETLDYEMYENAPAELAKLERLPSEYFKTNLYATFWFEQAGGPRRLHDLIDAVGADRVLFETDFPHPTCLYPDPLKSVEEKMLALPEDVTNGILGENARKLYRL